MLNRLLVSVGLAVASTAITTGGLHLYKKLHYGADGFNEMGYDRDGYDRQGFDKHGYDRKGYDRNGRNAGGYYRDGYNDNAVDVSSFSREYYKIICEEMQVSLSRARKLAKQAEYEKTGIAVREGLTAGIKAVIFHWKGASCQRKNLYMNLMLCEEEHLLPAEFMAELYDAEGCCDVSPEAEQEERAAEADAICETLAGLLAEVRKFT